MLVVWAILSISLLCCHYVSIPVCLLQVALKQLPWLDNLLLVSCCSLTLICSLLISKLRTFCTYLLCIFSLLMRPHFVFPKVLVWFQQILSMNLFSFNSAPIFTSWPRGGRKISSISNAKSIVSILLSNISHDSSSVKHQYKELHCCKALWEQNVFQI